MGRAILVAVAGCCLVVWASAAQADTPPRAVHEDWRRGPTDPVYLAIGVRLGGGPVWAQSLTAAGSILVTGRLAGSFGDVGLGIVLRSGFDVLSESIDYYTPAGLTFHADGWLAVFGMTRQTGFFERGAYVGVGAGYIIGTLGYGLTLHHPIVQLAEGVYLGGDLTCTGQVVTSCGSCPTCGCHSQNIVVQVGIEVAVFD